MDKIIIKGYKSIKDLELELKPINILIGSNGSGKSNFLSFFALLQVIYQKSLRNYVLGDVEKFLHKGSKITQQIKCFLGFGKNAYSFELINHKGDFIFEQEGLWYEDNPYYKNPMEISNYSRETNLHTQTMPRANYIKNYLSQIRKYHFHDTGKNSPFHQMSNIRKDYLMLYSDGRNLASILYKIKEENPKIYRRIIATIESIASYFLDFILEPDNAGNIALLWRNKHSEQVYDSYDFSDGTIRFIALVTLLLQPQLPETLIIDEPELGLHPFAIAKLSGLVKSASKKGCQVIMATQSVELINHFKADDIIAVDNHNGESIFTRLQKEELSIWLDHYRIGDLWKQHIINQGQAF